ncbi:hypothetical protein D1BOALGB6SA_6154 [Olavius sp. associated proteobacterium Delta 1]|nr:hypothetical protein D1BOALGB6SA_6154 [Olavius sp. associated proteobacterium Delta 1]
MEQVKSQIPNLKTQITNKSQITMTKIQNMFPLFYSWLGGFFGHWNFDIIWDLIFGACIFIIQWHH